VTWQEYRAAWSALHGGFDPDRASPLIRGWIRLAYRGATRLAGWRVGPTTVTAAGLLICVAVPFAAALGPVGLLLGGLLVLLAAVADGLDGAVAVISGTTSRTGFVLDSVADRLGEVAWLIAFWVAGVPAGLLVPAGAVSWLHEYVRARAAVAGMAEIGVVTVGERPTRVAVAAAGLVVAGAVGLLRPGWAGGVLTAAAAAWLVLGLVGAVQLATAVRRALSTD
jgi:CDP-diacylglycerol--glycerol-3-phosphate 3-phosphatidyltransferase